MPSAVLLVVVLTLCLTFVVVARFGLRLFREAEVQDAGNPRYRDPLLRLLERWAWWPLPVPRWRTHAAFRSAERLDQEGVGCRAGPEQRRGSQPGPETQPDREAPSPST